MLAQQRYPFLSWKGRAALLVLDALGTAGTARHGAAAHGPPRLSSGVRLQPVRSILVFGCLAIGDALTMTPALRALRQRWPGAAVTLVTSPASARILDGNPDVDQIVPFELPWLVRWGAPGVPARVWRTVRLLTWPLALRRRIGSRPDVCIAFAPDVRTFLLAWRLGARWRVGHTFNGGAWLLTHPVGSNLWDGRHMVEHRLDLVRAVGAESDDCRTHVAIPAEDRLAADRWLEQMNLADRVLLVALAPGAGGLPYKRWPPSHFARVGDGLAREFGATVLVIGVASERRVVREVVAASGGRLLDATGVNPAAVLARCGLVVCNDTGTMHVARALGVPTVTVRGRHRPGDAALWGYASPDYARLSVRMDRDPCVRGGCARCRDVACMDAITPEAVLGACRRVLAPPADGASEMVHVVLPDPDGRATAPDREAVLAGENS